MNGNFMINGTDGTECQQCGGHENESCERCCEAMEAEFMDSLNKCCGCCSDQRNFENNHEDEHQLIRVGEKYFCVGCFTNEDSTEDVLNAFTFDERVAEKNRNELLNLFKSFNSNN